MCTLRIPFYGVLQIGRRLYPSGDDLGLMALRGGGNTGLQIRPAVTAECWAD